MAWAGYWETSLSPPNRLRCGERSGSRCPHAHSGFLDLAVQLGVVGLVIFGLLYLTTMSLGLSLVREQPKVAAWIVSTLVVQLFISLSENVFIGSGWLAVVITFRVRVDAQAGDGAEHRRRTG